MQTHMGGRNRGTKGKRVSNNYSLHYSQGGQYMNKLNLKFSI